MDNDDVFDLLSLVGVLVIFVPIFVWLAAPFFQPDWGGFATSIVNSTDMKSKAEIVPVQRTYTTADALLSLVVADQYEPAPDELKIDVGHGVADIKIDQSFLDDKTAALQQAWSVMPTMENVKFTLYVGPSGMRYWEVTKQ